MAIRVCTDAGIGGFRRSLMAAVEDSLRARVDDSHISPSLGSPTPEEKARQSRSSAWQEPATREVRGLCFPCEAPLLVRSGYSDSRPGIRVRTPRTPQRSG